jgi:tRNA pseudouridine32 synthase / 23S rRNA pseudouridine746 synthase
MPTDIPIVYADDALIVINKPAHLLSVPGRGADKADCASTRVQNHYPSALVVHRLDQATSGLMVLAQGPAMQRALSHLFATRQMHKEYVAVVHGLVPLDEGVIDLPIAADWPARPRQKVDLLQGKAAITRYRVLSRDPHQHTSRLSLEPITGRTHQLRVHLSAMGHAIVGDRLYSIPELALSQERLLLHAKHLAFDHPVSHEAMAWTAAEDF